jgi:hypothetical protein
MKISVFFRLLKEDDKEVALCRCISDLRAGQESNLIHIAHQETFALLPGSPVPYWVSDTMRRMFRDLPAFHGVGGSVQHGLSTKNDRRFLRLRWEVPTSSIGEGLRWVPFAKGGEFSSFYSDVHVVLDWVDDGRPIHEYLGKRYPYLHSKTDWILHPESDYFLPGLTYPFRSQKGFSARILPKGCMFAHVGCAIFPHQSEDLYVTLGFFNSRIVREFIKWQAAFGAYELGYVQAVPYLRPPPSVRKRMDKWARTCHDIKRDLDRVNEISHAFTRPALLGLQSASFGLQVDDQAPATCSLEQRFLSWLSVQSTAEVQLVEKSYQIDEAILDMYDISETDRLAIDRELGPHPGSYPHKDKWIEEDDAKLCLLYLTKELPPKEYGSKNTEDDSHRCRRRTTYRTLEEMAHALQVHPASVAARRRALDLCRSDDFTTVVADLISYCVGCLFGRWDIRIGAGEQEPPLLPDPEEGLPLYPPGALCPDSPSLQSTGLLAHVIECSSRHGLLVDDQGHKQDIVTGVEACLAYLFGEDYLLTLRTEIADALGRDLRTWLARDFFPFHIKRYSKSRRKAPIYWQLTIPSKRYSLWLYYHTLGSETLYTAVREYGTPKIEFEEGQLKELQGKFEHAKENGPARRARETEKAVENQETFLQELYTFRSELRRLADWGYDPDLNDGVIINIAPLHRLVPWREAEKMQQKLEQGEFEWSTMAKKIGSSE